MYIDMFKAKTPRGIQLNYIFEDTFILNACIIYYGVT